MSDYEIGRLNRNVLIKLVKEQQEIINKAIEYIEENKRLNMFADLRKDEVHNYDLECDADDLLDILKGEK